MGKVHFRTNVLLKSVLGKDLITDDNVAVLELVKNSFDANSKRVEITFENVKNNDDSKISDTPSSSSSKIIIQDWGNAMSESDLEDKWLNIAFSDKKTKKEEFGRLLAGNKGVGRLSCDRLGRFLDIYTRQKGDKIFHLFIDWKKFEIEDEKDFEIQDVELEIKEIPVHEFKSKTKYEVFDKGTILEIRNLREQWTHDKIVGLRRNLEKLINPNQAFKKNQFEIELIATEFKPEDKQKQEHEKINGLVENKIFEKLDFKTSRIESFITENGKEVITKLQDRGREIFELREKNSFNLLKNSRVTVYYLNPYSKIYFARQTGIRSVDFGSIFLFINGFRIPPYGDAGDDWLGLELRKGQGQRRYLGTREVVGRIEIKDEDALFRIISNRAGIVHDAPFLQLTKPDSPFGYFMKTFRRLERFVVEGIKWDSTIEDERKLEEKILKQKNWKESDEEYMEDALTRNKRALSVINKIVDAKKAEIIDLTVNDDFITEIMQEQTDKAKIDLNKIADQIKSKELTSGELIDFVNRLEDSKNQLNAFSSTLAEYPNNVSKTELKEFQNLQKSYSQKHAEVIELKKQLLDAEERERKVQEELELERQKNTYFLTSDRTISEEAKGLIHNVKITSKRINSNIDTLYEKILEGKIKQEEILSRLSTIKFNAEKALKISQLITRANFKSQADKQFLDVSKFVSQYMNLYSDIYESNQLTFVVNNDRASLQRKLSILDLSLVFDDLISNSEKAGATKVQVDVKNLKGDKLKVIFSDNGKGVEKKFLDKIEQIFQLGVTTTDGSGIGLHSVRKTLADMGGTIEFVGNGTVLKGATFEIIFS